MSARISPEGLMSTNVTEVLNAALALPDQQRAQLVDALIDSLGGEVAEDLDEAWAAEIERRSDEYDRGEAVTFSWEEVRQHARRECGLDG
jgi:putative addiction module component (TIGR02574 family)